MNQLINGYNAWYHLAMARPSEYEAAKIAKGVSDYIASCKTNNYLPTIEGLAVHLGVWRSTLYDWADPKSDVYHKEFHDIFEQLRAAQASQLLQNGLVNNYNSTITKLMLTKHGYNDKSEVDHTTKGERIAGFNFLKNGDDNTDNTTDA
jgi:DNA-packaging protein gp3